MERYYGPRLRSARECRYFILDDDYTIGFADSQSGERLPPELEELVRASTTSWFASGADRKEVVAIAPGGFSIRVFPLCGSGIRRIGVEVGPYRERASDRSES